MTKRESVYIILSTVVLLILLLPFLVLSIYNNPSIDDYAFAYYTDTLGLYAAQIMWYTQWTGRYASMFLLSLHPLVYDAIWLYKLISALMILFTGHAIYTFVRHVLGITERWSALLTGLLGLYMYMNAMPTLVQGFYWEPGAVVYQLGNILVLYFFVSVYKTHRPFDTQRTSFGKFLKNIALITVSCGLSETGMVLTFLVAFFNLVLPWLAARRPNIEGVIYFAVALVCSLIVFLAPGNYIRGDFGASEGEGFLLQAILLSISAAVKHGLSWVFTVEWVVFTALLIVILARFGKAAQVKLPVAKFMLFFLIAMGTVAATFTPGFYATKILAPERVVNVSYWAFVMVWMGIIAMVCPYLLRFTQKFVQPRSHTLILAGALLLLIAIDKSDNAYAASSDLLSGRAAAHDKEFQEREALVHACTDTVCYIPSFSVFPKSVFNEDMADYYDDSNLFWYAHHHHKNAVVGQFSEPSDGFYRHIDFEPKNTQDLENLNTIVDSISRSGAHASFVHPIEGYSASLKLEMSELSIPNFYFLGRGRVTGRVMITESNCAANLVFVITKPGKSEALYWRGGPVDCSEENAGKWQDVTMRFPLEKRHFGPDHKIAIYLWNHGPSGVYLDDLEVWLY